MEIQEAILRNQVLEIENNELINKLNNIHISLINPESVDVLSSSALKFITFSNSNDVLNYLGKTLKDFLPSSIVLVNTASADQLYLKVHLVLGVENNLMSKLADLIGFSVIGRDFIITESFRKIYQDVKLHHHAEGLTTFSESAIPHSISRLIERILNISNIYTIGLRGSKGILGNVHVFAKNGTKIENESLIEAFVFQASIAYERCIMFEKLIDKTNRLEESNASKDKFFSIIAHDLRNPFGSIMGLSRLMSQSRHTPDPVEVKKMFSLIYENTKSSYELLENLLEWSRSQMGILQIIKEQIELNLLFEKINIELGILASQKDIKIRFSVKTDFIFADREMIRTILRNLITNAIKFSNRGDEIEVNVEKIDSFIRFEVIDYGIGIDEDKIEDLFKLTAKIQYPGTENEKGSGLGLVLCKEFVEKQGGKLWVVSKKGKGAKFYFTIPVE